MLFGDNGQVMSMVHITVAPDITEFKERLVMILPDENIQAFTANDGIVMAGTITSQTHMDQALELANRYGARTYLEPDGARGARDPGY